MLNNCFCLRSESDQDKVADQSAGGPDATQGVRTLSYRETVEDRGADSYYDPGKNSLDLKPTTTHNQA